MPCAPFTVSCLEDFHCVLPELWPICQGSLDVEGHDSSPKAQPQAGGQLCACTPAVLLIPASISFQPRDEVHVVGKLGIYKAGLDKF